MAVTVNAAIIDEKDTVVVAIEKINAGDEIIWRDRNGDVQKITAATDVPMYHKVAIKEMPKGTEVVKYGEHIGLLMSGMYGSIQMRQMMISHRTIHGR